MKSSSSSSSLIYYIILNFLHLVWHSIIYHSLSMKDSNSTMKFLSFNLLSLAIPNLYFFLIFFSILLKITSFPKSIYKEKQIHYYSKIQIKFVHYILTMRSWNISRLMENMFHIFFCNYLPFSTVGQHT